MSNDWKKVSGGNDGPRADIWRYQKDGEEVSGIYTETHQTPNKMKPGEMTNVYTLKQANGELVAVFGKPGLDRQFEQIAIGDEVRVVYRGKQKSTKSGFSFHSFEVFSRKPDLTAPKDEGKGNVATSDIPF